MPTPAIAFVGRSGSGKTTVCEKVIAKLAARGLRVGAVKYFGSHDFSLDQPGKDSWRMTQAGAEQIAICSNARFAQIMPLEHPLEQDEVVARMEGADIIVIEGHRVAGVPAFQLLRSASERYPEAIASFDPAGTIAIITDGTEGLQLADRYGLVALAFDDVDRIVELIGETCLR